MSTPIISPGQAFRVTAAKPDRRKRGLPREGIFWVFVGTGLIVTGIYKSINLLILLAYLMIAVMALNWWLSRRHLHGLRAVREANENTFADSPALWYVDVHNDTQNALTGWIVHDSGPNHELAWFGVRLEPGHTLRLRDEVVIPERGRYVTSPLMASTRYPFGLFSRVVELAPSDERIVLPKLGSLETERFRHWLARSTRGDGRMHQRIRHLVSSEADIHGLRPFRPGDSPRWIHWRTSARLNELMVREFEDSSPPNLMLVVEPWAPPATMSDDLSRLEWMISLAATICKEWCREPEARLGLIVSRPQATYLPISVGQEHAHRALKLLAVENGSPSVPSLDWLDKVPRMGVARWLVLTSKPNSTLAAELTSQIGRPVATLQPQERVAWYQP